MNPIEQLHNEKKAIQKKMEELKKQLAELDKKEQGWKRFPPEEESWLRQELTMLHGSLLSNHTLFASVYLKHEQPVENTAYGYQKKKHPKSFSIDIEVAPLMEHKSGLTVYITIRTKLPEVEKIVREMYRQVDTVHGQQLKDDEDFERHDSTIERKENAYIEYWTIDHKENAYIELCYPQYPPPPPLPPYMKN